MGCEVDVGELGVLDFSFIACSASAFLHFKGPS